MSKVRHFIARRLYDLPNEVWNHWLGASVRLWVYRNKGDRP